MKLRLIGEREAAVSIDGRSTRDRVFWLIPGTYKKKTINHINTEIVIMSRVQ